MIIKPPTKIVLKKSEIHGYGVFASQKIMKDEIIEECLFLSFPHKNTEKIPVFYDYTFCFPRDENWHTHALVTGFGSYYNHSENPNTDWYTKNDEGVFVFHSLKDIEVGEELLINYANGITF